MNKRFRTGILILIPVILLALLSQISLSSRRKLTLGKTIW